MSPLLDRRSFLRSASVAALAVAGGGRLLGAVPAGRSIRVVQIGTEHAHADGKWRTLGALPDLFAPLGLFEPDAGLRERAAADPAYEGARWLEERELFALEGVDAVLVETELPGLVSWTRRALERGWHVHMDKPPGSDLTGLTELQDLARRNDRVLQMGYMYRYHPAFVFCREAVRNGWLGSIHAIHGEMGRQMGVERRPWLAAHYGGSMMLLGCHLLDQAIAILGEPEGVRSIRRKSFPDRDAFSDNETAVLEYPRAVATIRSLLFDVGGGDRRQFAVFGEKGTIEIRPLEPASVRMVLTEAAGLYPAGGHEVAVAPLAGRFSEQLRDFARMVRGTPSTVPEFSPGHDRIVQKVLLQATGRRPTGRPGI